MIQNGITIQLIHFGHGYSGSLIFDGTTKWANVMLSDGLYKTTNGTAVPGTIVEQENLGSMFVWIPRYAYKIESGYHGGINRQESQPNSLYYDTRFSAIAGTQNMKIEFLEGTSSNKVGITITEEPEIVGFNMANYVVHPAFNYGNQQITGMWIAKFTASRKDATKSEVGTSENLRVIPSVRTWDNSNLEYEYKACINMNNSGNMYGLNTNDNKVDPHMITNIEYGAVVYLTQSNYGINTKQMALCTMRVTGYGRGYANYYEYNIYQGNIMSSTANVTGIYDLTKGEMIAAYYNDTTIDLETIVGQTALNAPKEHMTRYEMNSILNNSKINIEFMSRVNGDAFYEILSEGQCYFFTEKERIFIYRHYLDYNCTTLQYTQKPFRPVIVVK